MSEANEPFLLVATTGVGVTVSEPVLTRNLIGLKAISSTCKDCASLVRDWRVGIMSICESKCYGANTTICVNAIYADIGVNSGVIAYHMCEG